MYRASETIVSFMNLTKELTKVFVRKVLYVVVGQLKVLKIGANSFQPQRYGLEGVGTQIESLQTRAKHSVHRPRVAFHGWEGIRRDLDALQVLGHSRSKIQKLFWNYRSCQKCQISNHGI